jgi:histidinol phosphatase-like PHP family hydrolase
MKIRQNLHIHSRHSCDSACAALDDIQREMMRRGMTEFGISDHLHSNFNNGDIENARKDFLSAERPAEFHFGIK